MEERLIKVGITHGDINGIGYEVILKTFSDTRMAELCTPIIYGSSKIAAYHRKALELPPINMNIISHAEDAGVNRVNIINCVEDETKVELSKSTPVAGLPPRSINIISRTRIFIFPGILSIWRNASVAWIKKP